MTGSTEHNAKRFEKLLNLLYRAGGHDAVNAFVQMIDECMREDDEAMATKFLGVPRAYWPSTHAKAPPPPSKTSKKGYPTEAQKRAYLEWDADRKGKSTSGGKS